MAQDVEVMDAESIALSRRIKEILEQMKQEKGDAFSIRAFSKRIGMLYETFRKICIGKRPCRPSKLEKIAQGFGLSVERVKGTDVQSQLEELKSLVLKRKNMKRAIEIAETLLPIAVGYSEKFEILNNMGAAYYYAGSHHEAEKLWLAALETAKGIEEHFEEREPLYKASTNVLLVYEALKNFKTLRQLLDDTTESLDQLPPMFAGTLCYSLGEVALSVGDLSDYRRKTYDSLDYFRLTGNDLDLGMAEFRVGEAEFRLGNYSIARDYAALSMEHLARHEEIRYFPVKNYVKALLKLGAVDDAVHMIKKAIQELSELDQPKMLAKFHLLNAIANDDIQSAEHVLQYNDSEGILHLLACNQLMSYYSKVDDSTNLMKYYRIAERIKLSSSTNWEVI